MEQPATAGAREGAFGAGWLAGDGAIFNFVNKYFSLDFGRILKATTHIAPNGAERACMHNVCTVPLGKDADDAWAINCA